MSSNTPCMDEFAAFRQRVEQAAAFLADRLPRSPEILIQTGTGLGHLASGLTDSIVLEYREIPGFLSTTVESHAGRLCCGAMHGRSVAVLQGRFHYYEGYSAREVGLPIRVLALLGCRIAIITNAAGGLNPDFAPGSLMALADHLNFLPDNPLRGPNVDEWGPRFPDCSAPYDAELRHIALETAAELGLPDIHSGTYVCVPGPSLETPAETRFLRRAGADAVGMSSIPEILTAIHGGMRVLGLSVIANVNDPDRLQPILLDDIVRKAGEAEPRLQQLIRSTIARLSV